MTSPVQGVGGTCNMPSFGTWVAVDTAVWSVEPRLALTVSMWPLYSRKHGPVTRPLKAGAREIPCGPQPLPLSQSLQERPLEAVPGPRRDGCPSSGATFSGLRPWWVWSLS